ASSSESCRQWPIVSEPEMFGGGCMTTKVSPGAVGSASYRPSSSQVFCQRASTLWKSYCASMRRILGSGVRVAEVLDVKKILDRRIDPDGAIRPHRVVQVLSAARSRHGLVLLAVDLLPLRPDPVDVRVVEPEDRVVEGGVECHRPLVGLVGAARP